LKVEEVAPFWDIDPGDKKIKGATDESRHKKAEKGKKRI
jgi:hypothetical protein